MGDVQFQLSHMDDYEQGLDTRAQYDDAMEAGDNEVANQAMGAMRQQAAMAHVQVLDRGGDPRFETSPIGAHVTPEVEVERRLMEVSRKNDQVQAVWDRNKDNINKVQSFMTDVADEYKRQYEGKQIKYPSNEQEFIEQVKQNKPVIRDPNVVADMRQTLVKIDQELKTVDKTASVFTDPRTKDWAQWINREAGQGGVGFFTSGEQQIHKGAMGVAGEFVWSGLEGASDFGTSVAYGVWNLADRASRALGGPSLEPPSNSLVGPDGKTYGNSGKVPGIVDSLAMAYAAATDSSLEDTVNTVAEARQMDAAQRGNLETIVHGLARIYGMTTGVGLPAGAAMNAGAKSFGPLLTNGIKALAKDLGQASPRADKIAKMLGNTFGAAAGNGAMDAAAYGNQEGYAKAFLHGMAMAPAMIAFGWMGKRTEHWLERKNMPGRLRSALGGAVEGVGFGTMEIAQMGDIWNFLKDPNESTFATYAKNILGFMLVKGVHPGQQQSIGERAFGSVAPEVHAAVTRGRAREKAGTKISEGKATAEDLGKLPEGVNPDTMKQLGEVRAAKKAAAEAQNVEEFNRLSDKQKDIEHELDVQEHPQLQEPGEAALKEAEKGGEVSLAAPEKTVPTHEEIQRVRDMPTGHEKNVELTKLMQRTREALPEVGQKYASAMSEHEMANAKELYEAHQQVRKMVGEKPAPKFEQLVGETIEKRDVARRKVEGERRAFMEAKLADLERREAKLSKRNPMAGKMTAGEEAVAPEELAKVRDEIGRVRGELGIGKKGERTPPPKLEQVTQKGKAGEEETYLRAPEFEEGRGIRELSDEDVTRLAKLKSEISGKEVTPDEVRQTIKEKGHYKLREGKDLEDAKEHEIPSEAKLEAETPGSEGEKAPSEGGEHEPHGHPDDERRIQRLPTGQRQGPGSLQVPPTRQLEATPGTEQVRASDIFAEMQGRPGKPGIRIPFTAKRVGETLGDQVRVAMRAGRVVGKGVLGVFKYFENLARTKEGRDLVVGAHEWSHAMQRHALSARGGMDFKAAVKAWNDNLPPEVRDEFDTILKDYPGQDKLPQTARAMEAWAEWGARDLLGDETLHASVPELTRVMQDFLAMPVNKSIFDQYTRIKEGLKRYNEQGALGRLRMSTVVPGDVVSETQKATQRGWKDSFATSANKYFFDDIVELKKSQEVWLKAVGKTAGEVNPLDDPARIHDAYRMSAGKIIGHWVKKGIQTPAGHIEGVDSIMKRVKGNERDFVDYLVAVLNAQRLKHTTKVVDKNGNVTFKKTPKTAQLPMRDLAYDVKMLQTAHPEFRQAARDLKKWSDSFVDYAADAGSLSRESAEKIKKASAIYVPFFRDVLTDPKAKPGGGSTVAQQGSGVGFAEGSTFEIKDPLGSLIDNATNIVTKAHSHMVMSAVYKMAIGHELGGLASIVPKDRVPSNHPVKQVLDALEKKLPVPPGVIPDIFDVLRDADALDPQTVTFFTQRTLPTGKGRSILAFTPRLNVDEIDRISQSKAHKRLIESKNNKLQWLEVDTAAYETLMGIDKSPSLGWLDKPVLKQLVTWPAKSVRFFATGVSFPFMAANQLRDIMSYAVFKSGDEFKPTAGMRQWATGIATYFEKKGHIRELYDSLGVRSGTMLGEGERKAMFGQHRTVMQKSINAISDVVDRVKSFFEAPENFLRIAEFRKVYESAKQAGASEAEARIRAVEAGREITVNFARAGILARAMNQVIPYFSAALQGQRKLFKQLALGGEATTDGGRARVQRAAFANGIASITAPSLLLWWFNHDKEWYQDLPEWRKSMFFNFRVFGHIISIPKPFEMGVLFGSVPEAIADSMYSEGKPVRAHILMRDTFLGYLDGPAALLPAFIRPLIEGQFNYNAFFGRALTPEWIARGRVPEEQATFYTTEIAKILSGAVGGAFTPIEIEHYLGSYTAGASTSALRVLDEITGLKDHPGLAINPFLRFTRQEVHGQSRAVDQLYSLSVRLDQEEGSDKLTSQREQLKSRVDAAKRQISAIRKAHQQGRISREEANTRSYEIAKPLVK